MYLLFFNANKIEHSNFTKKRLFVLDFIIPRSTGCFIHSTLKKKKKKIINHLELYFTFHRSADKKRKDKKEIFANVGSKARRRLLAVSKGFSLSGPPFTRDKSAGALPRMKKYRKMSLKRRAKRAGKRVVGEEYSEQLSAGKEKGCISTWRVTRGQPWQPGSLERGIESRSNTRHRLFVLANLLFSLSIRTIRCLK